MQKCWTVVLLGNVTVTVQAPVLLLQFLAWGMCLFEIPLLGLYPVCCCTLCAHYRSCVLMIPLFWPIITLQSSCPWTFNLSGIIFTHRRYWTRVWKMVVQFLYFYMQVQMWVLVCTTSGSWIFFHMWGKIYRVKPWFIFLHFAFSMILCTFCMVPTKCP
jgi:hypothetical protein